MSFYRTTERGMWGDELVRDVSRDAKLLWAYLCCNEHDDLSGIYRLSPAIVEDELGLSRSEFLGALGELSGRVSYDPDARVVWVHNMLKKQGRTREGGLGSKHVEHARRQLESLPRTSLKLAMCSYYRDRFGNEMGYIQSEKSEAGVAIGLGLGSDSVSDSVSDSDARPPATPAPTGPRIVVVGSPNHSLSERIADACGLPYVDPRLKLAQTAQERLEDGVPEEDVLLALAAHRADQARDKPDRISMLWHSNWPATRARYLAAAPTDKRRDPVAMALEIAANAAAKESE